MAVRDGNWLSRLINTKRETRRALTWTSSTDLHIDGTVFHASVNPEIYHNRVSDESGFLLVKNREMVEAIVSVCDPVVPQTIVDIGIWQGGSVALLDRVFRPEKLIALEYSTRELPTLDTYIAKHRREENVKVFKGVNQGDARRITAILDAELGGRKIDLVVDDASHFFDETRISFNCIFPRVAPNGVFMIEDWQWSTKPDIHKLDYFKGKPGLANLVALCMIVCGARPDIVSSVLVTPTAAIIRRGPADLSEQAFDITDYAVVRGEQMPLVM
jgi:hypothetical protein